LNVPELITDSLLVAERFRHGGMDYERGDRLAVRHRWVRRVARDNPEWFRLEYAPEDIDLAWLDSIEGDYEERYQAVLRAREEEKKRRERALVEEYRTQERPQPEMEKAFKKQEAEDQKRKERVREEREREIVEREIELRSGFHF
jgi:hypothetical protein